MFQPPRRPRLFRREFAPTTPVWKGPEVDGITQSLLGRFLVCRERFRLLVVEGLKPSEGWNHRLGYGEMWHVCEEALADGGLDPLRQLAAYTKRLIPKFPLQQQTIIHWYNVCKVQFPIYVEHWSKHPEVVDREPILQEHTFNVPYQLPSGRVVRLRGKWDSVDLVNDGRRPGIYLQENKTKGDVDPRRMARQLQFDLQVMFYLVALTVDTGIEALEDMKGGGSRKGGIPINGVRYNVVRRPLSGGRGSIVKHKAKGKAGSANYRRAETDEEFYERLGEVIREDQDSYFMRWKAEVTRGDISRFRRECLDPVLEQLCDWWEAVISRPTDKSLSAWHSGHWRFPFGVYNPMTEGGGSELDEYLASGSTAGLTRTDNLFPELE